MEIKKKQQNIKYYELLNQYKLQFSIQHLQLGELQRTLTKTVQVVFENSDGLLKEVAKNILDVENISFYQSYAFYTLQKVKDIDYELRNLNLKQTISKLYEQTLRLYASTMRTRNLSASLEFQLNLSDPGSDIGITTDYNKLKLGFYNILSNAIRYSAESC